VKKRKPFAVVGKRNCYRSWPVLLNGAILMAYLWRRDAVSAATNINSALAAYLDDIGREAIGRVSRDAKRRGRVK
jgi:hypothetical protein